MRRSLARWSLRRGIALALGLAPVACTEGQEAAETTPQQIEGAGVVVQQPFLPAPPTDVAAVYLTVVDVEGRGDRLLGASSSAAERTLLHQTISEGGSTRMAALPDGVEVPAGGQLRLEPGGVHIMLMGLQRELVDGDQVELLLRFARAGTVTIQVPVVSYRDVEALTAPSEIPAP